MTTDVFTMNWTELRAYANPPWNLTGRVLVQTCQQQAELVLVAPMWKTTGVAPCATGNTNTHTTLDPPEEESDSSHTPGELPEGWRRGRGELTHDLRLAM